MKHLFRYIREAGWPVLLIVLLLVVQAACDLSLPSYTANLVDVGIQQGGIDRVSPELLSQETYDQLNDLLTQAQATQLESAYTQQSDGTYSRNQADSASLDALDDLLLAPLLQLASGSDQPVDVVDGISEQQAILFVKEEYSRLGVDLNQLQMEYLMVEGGKMLGLALLLMTATVVVSLLASRAAAKVGKVLRSRVFQKVVSFSSAELDHFSSASLITRTTNDIQQIQTVTVMLLRMVLYAPIIGIGGIVLISTTQTGLTWIIGVAVGAVAGVVALLMAFALPRFQRMQKLVDGLNLVSREVLTGLPVIRAFSREERETQRFDVASTALTKNQLFTSRCMSLMMPSMTLIMNAVSILVVWFGGFGIQAGTLQVGQMIAFLNYTVIIIMAFLMISMVSVFLPRAAVSATRIHEVLSTQASIADPEQPVSLDRVEGVVQFEDVSFHFPNADGNALEHISFTAQPGQTTAIIGSTGSGKSTLLHLLLRFFDVTGGRITIDGVDIRQLSQQNLRSLLGFVPQKGVLFSGDILSNLTFGGDHITEEQAKQSADIAQASDFITAKPEGYHSHIAQGGTNVSGGQKQRLSIARALAKEPQILLFDDSFSALDSKTDLALRQALGEQLGQATLLIVAQRISTILHADQILVLDEGQLVGIGTHAQLMASCQTYQEIATSQLSQAELGGASK